MTDRETLIAAIKAEGEKWEHSGPDVQAFIRRILALPQLAEADHERG